jgi:endonuclease/exonuclease/phosphatase family metal-dependent hydrolase
MPRAALFGIVVAIIALSTPVCAAVFSVASYNVENYLDAPRGTRPVKPAAARSKIRESLRALQADVVAFQEMGGTNALLELRSALKAEGLDYPHWAHATAFDTNIHVAVLSRFPILANRSHTKDAFLLKGRRFRISRAFLELDLQVTSQYKFTLFAAHLKSRRPIPEADEAEMREQEAVLLREKIEARLTQDPNANLLVLGDFNDVKDSKSTRTLIGRGRSALIDTRPAERNQEVTGDAGFTPRTVTWTHFYAKEDTYSRIDYILLSRGMAREWEREGTFVLATPGWGIASDHRPIVAKFTAANR